jgi:uncharacterized repeat protein (TIGR02543 family)
MGTFKLKITKCFSALVAGVLAFSLLPVQYGFAAQQEAENQAGAMDKSVRSTSEPLVGNQIQSTSSAPLAANSLASARKVAVEMFKLANVERKKNGKKALKWDEGLYQLAQIRANEIVKSFSHYRPDGSDCFSVFEQYGVEFYSSAGENIAMGFTTPKAVTKGWMNSPGHKANMLSGSFEYLGCAVASSGKPYYVQLFCGTAPSKQETFRWPYGKMVDTEAELRNAVAGAHSGTPLTISVTKNIRLSKTPLTIPANKNITLGSKYGKAKIIGASKQDTVSVYGKLTLNGVTLTHASGKYGRGVTVYPKALLTLKSGAITGNKVTGNGGGILNEGTVTIKGGTLSKNSAKNGGAIFNESEARLNISNSTISGNTASANGGAIYTKDYNALKITKTAKFSGNRAKAAYRLASSDKTSWAIYKSKVLSKKWSSPFKYGYNNFDINYTDGKKYKLVKITFNINYRKTPKAEALYFEKGKSPGSFMIKKPARKGYVFKGWNTKANGKGTALTAKTKLKSNKTVYAIWKKK